MLCIITYIGEHYNIFRRVIAERYWGALLRYITAGVIAGHKCYCGMLLQAVIERHYYAG
jgi:hypothetical protein